MTKKYTKRRTLTKQKLLTKRVKQQLKRRLKFTKKIEKRLSYLTSKPKTKKQKLAQARFYKKFGIGLTAYGVAGTLRPALLPAGIPAALIGGYTFYRAKKQEKKLLRQLRRKRK